MIVVPRRVLVWKVPLTSKLPTEPPPAYTPPASTVMLPAMPPWLINVAPLRTAPPSLKSPLPVSVQAPCLTSSHSKLRLLPKLPPAASSITTRS
ncbi:hypothetical protein D3C85_1189970 [compost metagenome]